MNIKHILIALLLNSSILSAENSSQTEEEKEIKSENKYTLINRELNLYYYNIEIGGSLGITPNITTHFDNSNLISLLVYTPYKTPNIMNRFQFNIAGELLFKNFTSSRKDTDLNIVSLYLLLHNYNKNKFLKFNYGLGLSQLYRSSTKTIAPCLKIKAEYQIDFYKLYMFFVENDYINKNLYIMNFLDKKFQLSIGIAPELFLDYIYINEETNDTHATAIDFYLKINLFDL